MTVRCISNSFNVTMVFVRWSLSPQLFNVYIDGLSGILNKSTIGCSLVATHWQRINHLLYADDFCIGSLSSAGLQHLLSILINIVLHIL